MAEETTYARTSGKYLRALKSGQELNGADWISGDLLLTDRRLVCRADEPVEVPLAAVDAVGDRYDVNRAARAERDYLTLHLGDDVLLVTTPQFEDFRRSFYRAMLHGAVLAVRHPAVRGGVVQDVDWRRGRPKLADGAVLLVLEDDERVTIDRDNVAELETGVTEVGGEQRGLIEVEHTDGEGTSVETHLAGSPNHLSVLERLLGEGAADNRANVDLDAVERRVVMALYSGVSPFAIAEFVDIDVERVEAIYDRLIELDVIEVERERTEVALTAKGRQVASEVMGE